MRIVLYAVLALAALPAFPLSKGRPLPLRTLYTADRTLNVNDIDCADFSPNSYVNSWSDNGMLWIETEIPPEADSGGAEILCLSTERCYLAEFFLQTADGGWRPAGSAGTSLSASQKSLDTLIPAVMLPPGDLPEGSEAPRRLRVRLDSPHAAVVELYVSSAKDFIRRNSRLTGFFSAVLCAGIAVTVLVLFFGALFRNAAPALLAVSCLALIADIFMETGCGSGLFWQLFRSSRYIYKSSFFFLCAAMLAANLSVHADRKAAAAEFSPLARKAAQFLPFMVIFVVAIGILYVLLPISDSAMKFIPIFTLAATTAVLTVQIRLQIKHNPQSWYDCCLLLPAFYLIFLEQLFHALRFIPGTTAILTAFDNDNSIPEIAALFLVSGTAAFQIRREAALQLAALHGSMQRARQKQESCEKELFACTELSAMLVNSMQTLSAIAAPSAGNAPPEQALILKNGIRRARQLTTAISLLSNGSIGTDFFQTDAEPFNLHDFLLQAIRPELADLKLNNCFIDIHENYPSGECVSADKKRLSLILSFLMQAAAKRSRPGTTVMISAEYTDFTFVYTVHFYSTPLSIHEICRLLEQEGAALPEEQADGVPEHPAPCGIELHAAKKITDQLKGHFAISPDSDGNTVSFRVALAPAAGDFANDVMEADLSEAAAPPAAPQKPQEAPPAAETICILEEEHAVRNLLIQLLRPRYKTAALNNGEEFFRLFQTVRPDLILCSLTLAGKDAFALLADGRRDSSVPFIVLAAQLSPKMERELLRLGAADVIEKPFRPDILLLKINALIGTRRAHTQSLLQKINASLQKAVRAAARPDSLPPPERPADQNRPDARAEIPPAHNAAPLTALCISANLTKKETEIAFLIAESRTDKEIAQALDISPATVAVHNKNIFKKLGIHTRKELSEKAGD
ncbi:MAG: response regulator transcription factor [Treponemataceae bacterium]|nr:response regulator transcription factor [Treponemataceae bacterium]